MNSVNYKREKYKKLTENAKYTQEWKEYNLAQTQEKQLLYKLLDELLNVVPTRAYTFGRPRKSLRDMIFSCMIKTYANASARRIISDLELARKASYIQNVPHFNTVLNYFNDSEMQTILHYLIKISAMPLQQVEEKFAIDSSGFGARRFDRWVKDKEEIARNIYKYQKAHIVCGTKTNVVTSVKITPGNVADIKMFESLLRDTTKNFDVKEISADGAYSSRDNLALARKLKVMPYIPFKSNSSGKSRGSPTWARMYRLFTQNYEEFARHYHKRSNVESCFAMIKGKFGDFCRCRTERSQSNEILCKILAHNLTCLIHEIFELGIEVDFIRSAQKVV